AHDARTCLEMEVVWGPDGPVLTDIWLRQEPTEIMAALRRAGLNEVLSGAGTNRTFSVAWLRSRSGVIRRIEGVERARALRSILDVVASAAPGEVVGHVVDKHSRDQLGYVLAAGDTAIEARNHAL